MTINPFPIKIYSKIILQRNVTPKIRNTKLPQRREDAKKILILRVLEPSRL